jgi:hypothetical protein
MNAPALLLVALSVAGLATEASAQNCWLRNRFRIANSYSGSTSELNVDTGTQTTRPLVTNGANNNPGATCYSQGTCNVTSDYGYLHVDGTGSASNCAFSGTFLWLDQSPQAQFTDYIAVTSTTLPHGTPVQLLLTLTLDGHAVVQDSNPAVSFSALCYSGSTTLQRNDTTGTLTGIVPTQVGSQIMVQAQLHIGLYPYGLLGLGIPAQTATYSVDLTARVGIDAITPGVTLSTCSGVSYPSLTAAVADVGGGCGAGSPTQNATLPQLGQTQVYTAAAATPGQPVLLAWAAGPAVALPLGPCLVTEDPANLVLLLVGATDPAGNGTPHGRFPALGRRSGRAPAASG